MARRGVTLIELLATVSIVAVLVGLTLPAVEGAREAARRVQCANHLRQLALATQTYVDSFQIFPPPFNPGAGPGMPRQYSVFSRILPGLEQRSLFDSLNFDLDMADDQIYPSQGGRGLAANQTAVNTFLGVLFCPSDPAPEVQFGRAGTNYRANHGVRIGTEGGEISSGPFSWPRLVSVANVSDGLSFTALYCEKLRGRIGRNHLDPRVDSLIFPSGTSPTPAEFLVDCARRKVEPGAFVTSCGTNWLVGSLSQTMYNHCEPPNGVEPDCLLRGFNPVLARASARGDHPGGVNLGLADGSVRFVGQSIDRAAWRAFGTRAGRDVGGSP